MPSQAPAGYDPRQFPPLAVTVDLVVFTIRTGELRLLLIRRGAEPFLGAWALPGGFVRPEEDLDAAAARELREETGLVGPAEHLEQFRCYGSPGRDPRMRVVTVAYWAICARLPDPIGGTDAASAVLAPVSDIEQRVVTLAFDHDRIVADALERLRALLESTAIAAKFCPPQFTVSELRRVHEAIAGEELDPGNYQRRIRDHPSFVQLTAPRAEPGARGGRPASLWTVREPAEGIGSRFSSRAVARSRRRAESMPPEDALRDDVPPDLPASARYRDRGERQRASTLPPEAPLASVRAASYRPEGRAMSPAASRESAVGDAFAPAHGEAYPSGPEPLASPVAPQADPAVAGFDARARAADLARFYDLLEALEATVSRRTLANCNGRMTWPERGVYFIFEPGEDRTGSGSGPRVVRVGTHALTRDARTTLWQRLALHRGTAATGDGNCRATVFRRLVGDALMARDRRLAVETWGRGTTASRAVRDRERPLEREVSRVIGGMSVLWLAVDDHAGPDSIRGHLVQQLVALLSNVRRPVVDRPSNGWLGRYSPNESVRHSGLWNHRHVAGDHDPAVLSILADLIAGQHDRASQT